MDAARRALPRPLISASRATGRLFINIFSSLFLFSGFVATGFTTPVENFSVRAFNLLHWRLHLHSLLAGFISRVRSLLGIGHRATLIYFASQLSIITGRT
jgi:hypothetical protein